jgi:hypothetical protein
LADITEHFCPESRANDRFTGLEASKPVVPAKAGIQSAQVFKNTISWIPAFAGMTDFLTFRS